MSHSARAAFVAVLGSVLVFSAAGSASADGDCADSGSRHNRYHRYRSHARGYASDSCAPCADACRYSATTGGVTRATFTYDRYDYGYRYDYRHRLSVGTPWSAIRSRLYRPSGAYVRGQPRYWFYDRWPLAAVQAPGGFVGTSILDCLPVATTGSEESRTRGLERLYEGDRPGAREDFKAALAIDASDAKARTGALLSAFLAKDWKDVVEQVRVLAEAGEMRVADRLDLDGTFADPKPFQSIVSGLEDYTSWRFHDVDAQVAAAWSRLVTGDVEKARAHVTAALRFDAAQPAALALQALLDAPAPAAVPPNTGKPALSGS